MKIVSIREENTNEHYNPQQCHDGGGYYQPLIVITFDDGSVLTIDDDSCGDFGSRISAYYNDASGNLICDCYYGGMIDAYQWHSSFTDAHLEMLELVRHELGYNIPTQQEISDL